MGAPVASSKSCEGGLEHRNKEYEMGDRLELISPSCDSHVQGESPHRQSAGGLHAFVCDESGDGRSGMVALAPAISPSHSGTPQSLPPQESDLLVSIA